MPFLVMELLEGETLAERLSWDPISIDAALAIATQIAKRSTNYTGRISFIAI